MQLFDRNAGAAVAGNRVDQAETVRRDIEGEY